MSVSRVGASSIFFSENGARARIATTVKDDIIVVDHRVNRPNPPVSRVALTTVESTWPKQQQQEQN